MKITILDSIPGEEDEIIVRCSTLDDNVVKLLNAMKSGKDKMVLYKDEKIVLIDQNDVFYFESVDDRVFAYTEQNVYESKEKLYKLEEILPRKNFLRANKSTILNLNKVESLTPAFGSRFEAILKNECKVIISRMYVPVLKSMLGL